MNRRFFNTAGPCNSEIHYTVDPLPRLKGVRELIDGRHYFILHAPRQVGKTTYLYALMHALNAEGRYTALQVNIQPAQVARTPERAMHVIVSCIYRQSTFHLPETERPFALNEDSPQISSLQNYLSDWAQANPKPIVLLLDEADALLDENFLALLGQLRAGFETRPKRFPQSVALVGLRDVRDYKIRLRPGSHSMGTTSPFNVKSKSLFMQGFTRAEMEALLQQHGDATGQAFAPEVCDELWRLTEGQPWLVNALANEIVAELLNSDFSQAITLAAVATAKEQLIARRDTHLDSLADKLREAPVKRVVQAIIEGEPPLADAFDDAVQYTADLGLTTRSNPVRFANPIYGEIIPRVLSSSMERIIPTDFVDPVWYIRSGRLDMDALLRAFQEFYREHAEAWLEKYDFREVGRQLMLMAFLQRITNGGGRIDREMAVGRGRCDLCVTYGGERFVLELKLLRHPRDEARGLSQTARYCQSLGLAKGYLLLFVTDDSQAWEQRLRWEERMQDGVAISLLGM